MITNASTPLCADGSDKYSYGLKRTDGTTAAERLFGSPFPDVLALVFSNSGSYLNWKILSSKDMVNNKLCIWLVRFGRTALLQIAYVAGPHRTICAWHCIFNSDGQMHN